MKNSHSPSVSVSDYTPVGILCSGGHSENRAMPHWCWVSDLCPFGFEKPATSWVADSMGYRYAFNGKENDPTGMGGGGSTYDYGFRIYNAQIARFLSVDPLTASYPWYTPYQFAGNMPIIAIDLDGLEELIIIRWFDNSVFSGETQIKVLPAERDHYKNKGVQIIAMNAAKKDDFEKDYIRCSGFPRNFNKFVEIYNLRVEGKFIGEYHSSTPPQYNTQWDDKTLMVRSKPKQYKIDFPYDKCEVKDIFNDELLKTILLGTKQSDLYLTIEGYASPENDTGNPTYNQELSEIRANSIYSFLIEKGVPEDRIISVEGKGSTSSFGTSPENKKEYDPNRTAVITFTYVE